MHGGAAFGCGMTSFLLARTGNFLCPGTAPACHWEEFLFCPLLGLHGMKLFFFTIWRWDFPRSAGVRGGQGKILGSVGPQHNMTRSSFDIVVYAWGHVEP